ncbi:MAG: hypothetical protein ACMUIP_03700 [bacterium]
MKKYGSRLIVSVAIIIFMMSMFIPLQASAQFLPYPPPPLMPVFNPYYAPVPAIIPPLPVRRANQTTATIALPTPAIVPAALPVAPAPLITTTQLFLGLLLRIGEESGLFATNPALFWYIVGILY